MKRRIFLLMLLLIIFTGLSAGKQADKKAGRKAEKEAKKQEKLEKLKEQGKEEKTGKSKTGEAAQVLMHDYGDVTEELLKYWGNVEFIWDEYRIYADYVEHDRRTKTVTAKGRVTMSSKETVVSGEKLLINLEDKTGELYDVYGQMEPTVRYTAERWKQEDKDTQKFEKLKFTSCAQCVPRWTLICSKGTIKKKKYIAMKNVVLKFKKIPVLYLPYLSYPITDKSTGFLFPQPGNHYIAGTTLKNAFYWDIKSNIDMTLYLDYYSKAGWGFAEEFRYLFKNMEGNLKFYFLKYRMGEDADSGEIRNVFNKVGKSDYYINFKHIHNINFLNTKIVVDIDNQSDPSFLRLFDNNFDRSVSNRYYSSIFIKSSLSNVNMSVSARKNVTYYTFEGRETSNIIQYLPSVSLSVNQQKIWFLPGYFSFRSAFDNISRSGVNYEEGAEFIQNDFTSQRLNITPSYSLKLFTLPWLSSTVNLRSEHSIYFKSKDPEDKNKIINEPIHINYNVISSMLKGPIFYKIYESKKSKFKHIIEPEVKFTYSTQLEDEQVNRVARIDFSDRPPYSYVGFGLTSRLLKKNKNDNESPREVLSYTISQNYYIDPKEANFYRMINNEYPQFSELGNSLRLRFVKDFSLDFTVAYNYYIKGFSRANVLLSFNKENSIIKGSAAYTIYRNPYRQNFFRNKTYLRGDLDINIPGFPLRLKTGIDYDVTENEFRYGSVLASYNYQCIYFNAEFRMYTMFNGDLKYQYNFGISFGSIGMVKDFLGSQR
ncbi:MAG: LPS-assembly protein LptD [Candidatus Aminicenantes bacterium]|nr:LPS-assembly protein LptD [Candidatus Aminicenantes bacterium]